VATLQDDASAEWIGCPGAEGAAAAQ